MNDKLGLNTVVSLDDIAEGNAVDEAIVHTHYLWLAFLASLLLHVLIGIGAWMSQTDQQPIQRETTVSVFLKPQLVEESEQEEPEQAVPKIEEPALKEVISEEPALKEPLSEEQFVEADVVEAEPIAKELIEASQTAVQAADIPTIEPELKVVVSVPTEPIDKPAPRLKQSVTATINQFIQQKRVVTVEEVTNPPCDTRQQQVEVRNCQQDDSQRWQRPQRYEGTLTNAFGHLNVKSGYDQDMEKLTGLIDQQERIDEHIATMEDVPDFIAQEQILIAKEIDRIYKQNEQANLLKIISSGINVTSKIIDVIKDDD